MINSSRSTWRRPSSRVTAFCEGVTSGISVKGILIRSKYFVLFFNILCTVKNQQQVNINKMCLVFLIVLFYNPGYRIKIVQFYSLYTYFFLFNGIIISLPTRELQSRFYLLKVVPQFSIFFLKTLQFFNFCCLSKDSNRKRI